MQSLIGSPVRDLYFQYASDPMILGADAFAEGLPTVLTVPLQAALYNSNSGADATGHTWTPDQTYAGWTGTVAEAALPVSGTTAAVGAGTQLGYRVVFPAAATYYTWVRGVAPTAASSSLNLGLDNAFPATGQDVTFPAPSPSFQFTGQYASGSSLLPASVAPSAGAHLFDVAMRQDGVRFDQVQLTTDPSYIPEISALSYNAATSTVGAATDSTGHTWTPDTTYAGFYNTGAMFAGPATTSASANPASNAVLHYTVNFPAAGNYYLWVRGYGRGQQPCKRRAPRSMPAPPNRSSFRSPAVMSGPTARSLRQARTRSSSRCLPRERTMSPCTWSTPASVSTPCSSRALPLSLHKAISCFRSRNARRYGEFTAK